MRTYPGKFPTAVTEGQLAIMILIRNSLEDISVEMMLCDGRAVQMAGLELERALVRVTLAIEVANGEQSPDEIEPGELCTP